MSDVLFIPGIFLFPSKSTVDHYSPVTYDLHIANCTLTLVMG